MVVVNDGTVVDDAMVVDGAAGRDVVVDGTVALAVVGGPLVIGTLVVDMLVPGALSIVIVGSDSAAVVTLEGAASTGGVGLGRLVGRRPCLGAGLSPSMAASAPNTAIVSTTKNATATANRVRTARRSGARPGNSPSKRSVDEAGVGVVASVVAVSGNSIPDIGSGGAPQVRQLPAPAAHGAPHTPQYRSTGPALIDRRSGRRASPLPCRAHADSVIQREATPHMLRPTVSLP
ncbi:MAG TPA: hypothetical protein VHJ79_19800 [Mycobacterium sp.]|nr:hypothetical protein [Mycobacterium sp.]